MSCLSPVTGIENDWPAVAWSRSVVHVSGSFSPSAQSRYSTRHSSADAPQNVTVPAICSYA
ncbi:MAG: hypothetical protein IJ829_05395 [Kiritimatiellae bacterium]|nr:hypothetical protein [Kiritimatiellia bacterium]